MWPALRRTRARVPRTQERRMRARAQVRVPVRVLAQVWVHPALQPEPRFLPWIRTRHRSCRSRHVPRHTFGNTAWCPLRSAVSVVRRLP